MKLNFWQLLGVVLLIIGIAVWVWDKKFRSAPATRDTTATTSP